ncbi:hypothetical protein [Christiangramia sp.]|uniref:hypothetical protein n=1 Tax=Christiangramia sp. TaxID=1931228 RepID=UPI0026239A08|nr:hypothetical protein [Christiangramia sp.]
MKKIILSIFTLILIVGCTKDESDSKTNLTVRLYYEYENTDYLIGESSTVYIFDGINIHHGYAPISNGRLIKENTGEEISYSQKFTTSNGSVFIENLDRKTYAVIADMEDTFVDEFSGNKIISTSINLNNQLNQDGGKLDFTFDIWPYEPWTIFN